MSPTTNNWNLGEMATLKRQEKVLKKGSTVSYMRYIASRYICIQEATEEQPGILMKVLGKTYSENINIVNGEPFTKDDREELFSGVNYFSYPFPTNSEVLEALNILRDNQTLIKKFEEASMHVNPNSTFWVSDTKRNMLLLRKAQYVSGRDGQTYPASKDSECYRITFVRFDKGGLTW